MELNADLLETMIKASSSMVQQSQQLSAAEQGTFSQEICMQLELLMDGLSQMEASLQLRQDGQQNVPVDAATDRQEQDNKQQQAAADKPDAEKPGTARGASSVSSTNQTRAAVGDAPAEQKSGETDGNKVEKPTQQQQQQAQTALSKMTASHLDQLQGLILVALGNKSAGLNPKNLLAPLQLNQLILQRAEADVAALLVAISSLLDCQSSFAKLR